MSLICHVPVLGYGIILAIVYPHFRAEQRNNLFGGGAFRAISKHERLALFPLLKIVLFCFKCSCLHIRSSLLFAAKRVRACKKCCSHSLELS